MAVALDSVSEGTDKTTFRYFITLQEKCIMIPLSGDRGIVVIEVMKSVAARIIVCPYIAEDLHAG